MTLQELILACKPLLTSRLPEASAAATLLVVNRLAYINEFSQTAPYKGPRSEPQPALRFFWDYVSSNPDHQRIAGINLISPGQAHQIHTSREKFPEKIFRKSWFIQQAQLK